MTLILCPQSKEGLFMSFAKGLGLRRMSWKENALSAQAGDPFPGLLTAGCQRLGNLPGELLAEGPWQGQRMQSPGILSRASGPLLPEEETV